MAEFEQLMRTAALVGTALFAVLLLARVAWAWRTRGERQGLRHTPLTVRLVQGLRVVALVLFGLGLLACLFVLQRGTFFMPALLQAGFAIVFAAYVLLEVVLAAWLPRRRRAWLWGLGALATFALGALGLLFVLGAVRAFAYPPLADTVVLARVPFEGTWVVTGAGASSATNHHDRIASQKYAADLAALCDDGRLFRGDGGRQEDSCTFGAKVLSPVDGVVVHAVDGHPDGASREVLPGNHVIIRIDEGRHVALAHFRRGSILVKDGDRVRAGQEIARAGNSGNSDFAHLHLHVQDTPVYDIRGSRALPWRVAGMERRRYLWGSPVRDGFLLSNDRVRPAP